MERTTRHMQVMAGLVAAGALVGCLGLVGCDSSSSTSSSQPSQTQSAATQPAAVQQPTAAKQDAASTADSSKSTDADESTDAAKPSDSDKSTDATADKSTDATSDSEGRSDLQLGEFQAQTLKGGSFTQEDIAAKDVTVLNMWSTTCGPCINEMPELAAFAKAMPDNVQVVTYCFDGLYNDARAERVLQSAEFEGTTLVTADGGLKAILDQVQYTPTTIFISKDGTVVGDMQVGVPDDFEKTYLERVNDVLESMGEKGITLEEAK